MCKAVVFDMDGVILDSERLVHEAWRQMAPEYGFQNIDDVYYRAMGHSLEEIVALFQTEYGFDDYAGFRERAYAHARQHAPGGILPLRAGARELLDWLKAQNLPLALATATQEADAHRMLAETGVWEMFDVVVTGDMVTRCKPDPEIYLHACAQLGVAPHEACGVEDGANGILALHAAGMTAIMAEDQYHPTPEIVALCDAVLPSMAAVQAYFQARLIPSPKTVRNGPVR